MKFFDQVTQLGNKGVHIGYGLIVLLFGLPLITPLLRSSSSACTHDGHLHYHRLAALRYAWESGLFFSRWLPDVAFGYGYPFFLYREAVPLYLALLPHLLGLPLPAAINLFYAIMILAAGLFMFLWVRDLFGPIAGIVSAVIYMAAPYQLIDALIRGNQPESMALALFPLLGWAGRRFIIRGTPGSFLLSTLGLALLALSHNISTFLFVPFLFLYLLAVGWWQRLTWHKLAFRLVLIFGLGLALSAFFLGAALLELDEITISQSINRRGNTFNFNFASLGEIFAPGAPANPDLINPPLLIRLGLVPAGLAVVGLLCLAWVRSREKRGHIIFMAVAAVVLLFMSLPASQVLWENIPLISFVQFPWRFVGRAALPVAFLAGIPFAVLPQLLPKSRPGRYLSPSIAIVVIVVVLLGALPYLYPATCSEEASPTIISVHEYEHETGLVGVDPEGSYFPKTVGAKPVDSPLEADYQAGQEPRRLDNSILPPGATTSEVVYGPTSVKAAVKSPVSYQARYLAFDFPGWVATVDGLRVPITPSDPEGLITFPVPAGEHTLEVRWQMTPLRRGLAWFSITALFSIAIATVLLKRKSGSTTEEEGRKAVPQSIDRQGIDDGRSTAHKNARFSILLFFLAAAGFLAFKLLVVDQVETPFRRQAAPQVDNQVSLVAAELRLEGFNLSDDQVEAGDMFDIDLAWRTVDWPAGDYQSNVWLVGPEGLTWSDKETERPRIYEDPPSTIFWQPGRWAWDSREVAVLPGTPPGQYDIVLTLFDLADLHPLTMLGPDNNMLGPTTVIGQMQVVAPTVQPEFNVQFPLQEKVAGLTLFGYNQDRDQASPGDPLLLTLFWENSLQAAPQDTPFTLTLVSEDGQVVQDWRLTPGGTDYPPGSWSKGERVRGQHAFRLGAGLASGEYQFYLEDVPLGQLRIDAPKRVLEKPEYSVPAGVNFGGLVELSGYTIEADDAGAGTGAQTPLTVSLVWQGLAEMPVSYRVFVHLIDEAGLILIQSDAEPAGWLRPTTGWSPGEYVVDNHLLTVPDGDALQNLALRIGLYDAVSGQRLETDGLDFLTIPLDPDGR